VAPWVAILRYPLALVRLEEGDLDEAETLLGEAFRLDPRRPETVLLQGDVARRRGQHESAEAFYQRALSLGSRAAETRTALSALHLEKGDLDTASSEIEAALASKPGDAEALYTRARIRAARGDRDGARLDLLAAVTTGGAPYRGRAMAEADLRALLIEGAGRKAKEKTE
jgi:Tfp pilus assembly protein PilF